MRVTEALSVIETRLAGLVHPSVEDGPDRPAHEEFIVSRMVAGCLGLASLPPYLLWRGSPALIEIVAAVCLAAPALAAFVVSRTARLDVGHSVASASFAGLVSVLAVSSDVFGWPALLLLVAVPLEAILSGSRRAFAISLGAALLAGAVGALVLSLTEVETVSWAPRLALMTLGWAGMAQLAGRGLIRATQVAGASRTFKADESSLLQVIDDLVTWHDENGGVVKASRASSQLLGLPGSSLEGDGLFRRVHVSDRPAFVKAVSDAARSDRPVVVQFRLHRNRDCEAGSKSEAGAADVIWVEMRAHRMAPGAGAAVVAVARDISAHHRHAEDLQIARVTAERADGAKGRFLAIVSHELRTPLNAIIGFSEVLAGELGETLPRERQSEYADIIRQSGEHLLEVVNALLNMSQIEAGEFDFTPEPFDISALTHGCCDLLQLKADASRIRVERRVDPRLPEIVADCRAFRQILINLLSNALKFTPAGGHVIVSIEREVDRILLTVADTGIGIPVCDLPRIGDPFFQARASYNRPHEGTGLGLSVVRGLLALHRGTLSIESACGQGTLVRVTLPFDCRSRVVEITPVTVRTSARSVRPHLTALKRSA